MSISENFSIENQEVILRALRKYNRPLRLLELKKESALANLYFFEGLKNLEHKDLIKKTKIEGKTWISLH
ncbi:MAG: hypothetical protein ACFFDT_05915 [Candidatus Hodarchaeota archaeon]